MALQNKFPLPEESCLVGTRASWLKDSALFLYGHAKPRPVAFKLRCTSPSLRPIAGAMKEMSQEVRQVSGGTN